jgi:hypothetical protein
MWQTADHIWSVQKWFESLQTEVCLESITLF